MLSKLQSVIRRYQSQDLCYEAQDRKSRSDRRIEFCKGRLHHPFDLDQFPFQEPAGVLRILLCRRKHVIYQMCPGPKPYFAQVLTSNIERQTDWNQLNNSHEIKYEPPWVALRTLGLGRCDEQNIFISEEWLWRDLAHSARL